MAYTALQLITRAYYLSGIVGRQYQTVSGDELQDGLFLLNDLLAEKGGDISLIPYYTEYSFSGVIGQEKYFVPNLVTPETLTFYINNVRYSTMHVPRDMYFGTPRADGVNSLPNSWHVERTVGGSNLYIYFTPDQAYPMKLWGKFALTSVATPYQDLSLAYDRSYLTYLRYALAEYICLEYRYPFPPEHLKKLRDLEYQFRNMSPPDLTISKLSTFRKTGFYNYADVNLGKGWTTS